jgi:hypothetical protein
VEGCNSLFILAKLVLNHLTIDSILARPTNERPTIVCQERRPLTNCELKQAGVGWPDFTNLRATSRIRIEFQKKNRSRS